MIAASSNRFVRPLQYVALGLFLVFLSFPLLFLIMTSFKTQREVIGRNASFFPQGFNLESFSQAIDKMRLWSAGRNSLIAALATTVLTTLISLPAAYALARFQTKLRAVATGWILLSQAFPFVLTLIPLFIVLRDLKQLDSLVGLILVYTVWALPFALWMLRGYIASIPMDLEEAGAIDGASRLRVLRSIILPLLAPGLVATSLFTFIGSWNEFLFALVVISSPDKETLPVTLARFVGSEGQVQLGQLAAGAVLATIPSLIFFALIQRRLTSGLLSGAVKG